MNSFWVRDRTTKDIRKRCPTGNFCFSRKHCCLKFKNSPLLRRSWVVKHLRRWGFDSPWRCTSLPTKTYGCWTKNRGTPKWMVYNGKPYQNGWFGGYHYFWKHPYPTKREVSENHRLKLVPKRDGILLIALWRVPSLKIKAKAPEKVGLHPKKERILFFSPSIFGCELVSFREGIWL